MKLKERVKLGYGGINKKKDGTIEKIQRLILPQPFEPKGHLSFFIS